MTIFKCNGRAKALAAIGVSVISLGLLADADSASAAAKAKAAAKPGAAPAAPQTEAEQQQANAAATRQAYENGIKSYSTGKYQPAVDLLSTALRGGGLGSAEMAKALYTRGLAYKKLSKPGLAISDLTSALWLKNGLGEADQKSAIAERADAYRAAGLGDGNSGAESVSVADPNPTPAGAKASAPASAPAVAAPSTTVHAQSKTTAAVPAPIPAASSAEITRQSPDSEAARDAANARKLAAAPIEAGGMQAAAAGSFVSEQTRTDTTTAPAAEASTAPVTVAAAAPATAAPMSAPQAAPTPVLAAAPIDGAPPVDTSKSSGLGTVGNFFSNLFSSGSSSSAPQAAAAPVTTASTTPAPQTSSWSDTTSVASGRTTKVAAATPVPQKAVAPAMPSGKYKLHIAAVRSRAEAEALAQKLATQQGAALKSRTPVVDEAVIGSMGTFYRVRVGSYANAEEPRGVCNALRSSGFDCLVVTN